MTITATIAGKPATIKVSPELVSAIAARVVGLRTGGMNQNELAAALGKTRHTIARWCSIGRIPHRRFGQSKVFYLDEVEEALKGGVR